MIQLFCLPAAQGAESYCRGEKTCFIPSEFARLQDDLYQTLLGFPIVIGEPEVVEDISDQLFVGFRYLRFRIRIKLMAQLKPFIKLRFEHKVVNALHNRFACQFLLFLRLLLKPVCVPSRVM